MSSFKDRHIELGSNLHRGESLKEKYEKFCTTESVKYKPIQETKNFNLNDKGQHVIVLVHGYQASRQDFQVLKLCL